MRLKITLFLAGALVCCISSFAQLPPCQSGTYTDNFHYTKAGDTFLRNSFNNWFWEIFPQIYPADKWVSFKFNDNTEAGCSYCAWLTIKADTTDDLLQYQDAEIFNNACVTGINEYCYMQPDSTHISPFPNGRLHNTKAPYIMENAMADSGAMYIPITTSQGIYRSAPYYPSDTVAYSIHMRLKCKGKTFGTRGWGFWNTMWDYPDAERFAWFYEWGFKLEDEIPVIFPTAITLNADSISFTVLFVNVYEWHDYKINWCNSGVQYFIDGALVADHRNAPRIDTTQENNAYEAMAYHCWVDNRVWNTNDSLDAFNSDAYAKLPIDKSIIMDSFSAGPILDYQPQSEKISSLTISAPLSGNSSTTPTSGGTLKTAIKLLLDKYGDEIKKHYAAAGK